MDIMLNDFRNAAKIASAKLAQNGYKDGYVIFSELSYIADPDDDNSDDYTVNFRCATNSAGDGQQTVEIIIRGDTVVFADTLANVITALALEKFGEVAVY